MRDRLRPAVLVRKVLLPPVLAGGAVCCLLGALALTISSGSRANAPNPLARTTADREPLAIGLSLELGVTARLRPGQTSAARPPVGDRRVRLNAAAREPATLARPVAGVVGGCGTFGCPRPGHLHHGVDFLAAAGTPVHAAASGVVALVQSPAQSAGYGNFVCVQHRPALATCYAHLSAVAARVRVGERVRRGQLVGLVGATGSASTPHLHFEVRRGPAGCGQCAVDPLALLPRAAGGTGPPIPDEKAAATASAPGGEAPADAAPAPSSASADQAPAPVAPAPRPDPPAEDDATTIVEAKPARPDRIVLPPEAVPPTPAESAPLPPVAPPTPLAPDAPPAPPG